MAIGPPQVLRSDNIEAGWQPIGSMAITLRDQFAIAALGGMSANHDFDAWSWREIAEAAYDAADAMLAEREKRKAA